MKWERVLNSFILVLNNDYLNLHDFKVSSNICTFYESPPFSLDDITNISYSFFSSILSTSNICNDVSLNNSNQFKYIHNIKISVSIRLEYKSSTGIKLFNFSSNFGDFVTSLHKDIDVTIKPQLMCLWVCNNNIFNLSLNYILIANNI